MTARSPLPALLLAALLGPALAAPAAAHELGAVQAKATFLENGSFGVDLTVDEEHLDLWQAGAIRGAPCGEIAGLPREKAARFGGAVCGLLRGSEVRFDGRPRETSPSILPTRADDPPGRVVLHLAGDIPGGARAFAFRLDVPVGTYPLALETEGIEGSTWLWLDPGKVSAPFELHETVAPPTRLEVVERYLKLGFLHIVPKGLDHILFVLGLMLLSRRIRPLLAQVTCFTVAHTISLGLAASGLVSLPASIVEPAIALSIVYVAVENILRREVRRSRLALVFAFGLLHGLGFAGVLAELGLPRTQFFTALFSFNLGVEAGQLTIIVAALLLAGLPFGRREWYRRRVVVPASAAIAAVGLFWSIQRVLAFSGVIS
jgi:hydrogenase/urease accessory protein HupE